MNAVEDHPQRVAIGRRRTGGEWNVARDRRGGDVSLITGVGVVEVRARDVPRADSLCDAASAVQRRRPREPGRTAPRILVGVV